MPQNPGAVTIAVNPSGAQKPVKADASQTLVVGKAINTTLNVTVPAVIRTGVGRVGKLIIVTAPTTSGAITLNDAATTGAAAAANAIFSIPYNGTGVIAGAIFDIDVPVTNGLVVSAVGGGTPQYTITWS